MSVRKLMRTLGVDKCKMVQTPPESVVNNICDQASEIVCLRTQPRAPLVPTILIDKASINLYPNPNHLPPQQCPPTHNRHQPFSPPSSPQTTPLPPLHSILPQK